MFFTDLLLGNGGSDVSTSSTSDDSVKSSQPGGASSKSGQTSENEVTTPKSSPSNQHNPSDNAPGTANDDSSSATSIGNFRSFDETNALTQSSVVKTGNTGQDINDNGSSSPGQTQGMDYVISHLRSLLTVLFIQEREAPRHLPQVQEVPGATNPATKQILQHHRMVTMGQQLVTPEVTH